jgi:hypothetical protein
MASSYKQYISESGLSDIPDKLQKIRAHNNICQIFIGGSEHHEVEYPSRLQPVHKVREPIREAAEHFILDSSINNGKVTNREVVEKAIKFDVDYVIPCDVWGEIDETHESVLEFVDIYHELNCEATIIFPLQPPHDVHFLRYEDFYSEVSHLAIGGLKHDTVSEQIAAARKTRDAIGPYKHLHGLGMGCSKELVEVLWENHNLLDSLDTSTFERLPSWGKIAGRDWEQFGGSTTKDCDCPTFEMVQGNGNLTRNHISGLNAVQIEYLVHQLNYQLTPFSKAAEEFGETQPHATNSQSLDQPDDAQMTFDTEEWNTPDRDAEPQRETDTKRSECD